VTIQVLASFTAAGTKPYTLGMYTPGTPNNGLHELLYTPTSESQSVFIHPQGATSFDPGSSAFGFYFVSNVQVKGRIGYSEDAFNTWDATNQRKFRFFPLERPDRSIVPNTFVMTSTEWNAPIGLRLHEHRRDRQQRDGRPVGAGGAGAGAAGPERAARQQHDDLQPHPEPQPTTGIIDQVHDTGTLRINNTGGSDLVINSISLQPRVDTRRPPAFPLTVTAGSSFDFSIKSSPPPRRRIRTTRRTRQASPTRRGVQRSITINSNDPNTPSKVVPLAGWWQQQSENNDEPSLHRWST